MDQNQQEALGIFIVIITSLVVVMIMSPKSVLPDRSKYVERTELRNALNSGMIILRFFYSQQCRPCEDEGKALKQVEAENANVIVEWINVKEQEGDRRVMEEVEEYQVTAVPLTVFESSKGKYSKYGYLDKKGLLDLLASVKP